MRFAQREPCRALQHLVKFYWMVEDACAMGAGDELVLPDGCMEMIFHFGTPFSTVMHGERSALQPRAFVGGQITRSIRISPLGPIGMLGVRFRPYGAAPLLQLAMDSIAGATIDIADLFGAAGRQAIEQLLDAGGVDARFDVVESFLLHLSRYAEAADPLAQASIEALTRSHGKISVQCLAADMHVSPRHLSRTLRRHVGLGAKAFARIMRLQYALAAINSGGATSLTDAACAAGYFDQSHFIRDFREFCAVSPGSFVGQRHALVDAFA